MAESQEDTRISIRLSPPARRAVEEIMQLGDFKTIQEAIRRAIGDELFLLQQKKQGWTVLLRKGNEYKELVWPNPTWEKVEMPNVVHDVGAPDPPITVPPDPPVRNPLPEPTPVRVPPLRIPEDPEYIWCVFLGAYPLPELEIDAPQPPVGPPPPPSAEHGDVRPPEPPILVVGTPEPPRDIRLPISHQQELARRRLAYVLVGILGGEVLIALLLLLCVNEPIMVPIENLRDVMTIIFGPTVALVGSATGFYFGTSRETNPPSGSSSPPTT